MSLVLNNVSYRYPGTNQGLSNVNIDIRTGELVAIIGPSGSGKSTLLKLVSGLESGNTGSILLDGDDLSKKPVHTRNIGMVFQSYSLFPHLNVAENVAYGLKLRRVPKDDRLQRANELLELVGLGEFSTKSVAKLSGGQQQRVALARALAINPKALLLDEPLAALDAGIRGHLRDQIKTLQQRFNATTLLVTHDQEEALTMADRVAVMKDGKLLQLATPREIYERPATSVVAEFVGLSTIFPGIVVDDRTIDLGFARVSTQTEGRAIGKSIFAMIRPEHIVGDPVAGAPNAFQGKVATQRFLGSVVRYDFLIEGAPKPVLAEANSIAKASISFPPEHIRLLDH
ncbi:ABC transporter ATP-binding protein [Burkholderia sp. Leaf177]|uniref:ABC transporter ATP-binding protein n=1 Tax=Burkholderia sp. Leaf177 TaxID=1736287 RepID=UPI000700C6C6|nr:ABC transporter ATP-binding protein [Burkholderia sp. Leaf177]KQR77075.1 ABC transporter ATP-binding protein [Burkholderia sp. Leaf177]